MYKLIAIDIDGTLLNSYGEVSKENKEAIKMAIDKNINVVLTSGRMTEAILPIANEICANKYLISGNGATIYDIENNKTIYNNYMIKEKVLEIIDICEKNSMFYNVYTNNAILTKSLNYNILFYHNENKNKPENKKIKINVIEDIYNYIKNYNEDDLLKITICDDNKTIFNSIMNKLRTVKNVDVLEVAHMSKKIIKYGTEEVEINELLVKLCDYAYEAGIINSNDVTTYDLFDTLLMDVIMPRPSEVLNKFNSKSNAKSLTKYDGSFLSIYILFIR